MFPKKKPAVTIGVAIGKGKPPMGGGGKFGGSGGGGGPKPKSPMDDLESPDPVEGPMDDGSDDSDDGSDSGDMPDMSAGSGYGAKLEKDIENVGAALGMEPGQAKKAAGAFFAAAAQCLSGGDEGDDSGGDETIDTEGSGGPGRYGQ